MFTRDRGSDRRCSIPIQNPVALADGGVGIDFWLKRYRLLYGSHRVNVGAGYTDAHAQVFAYNVMSVMAIGLAIVLLISIYRRGFGLVFQGLGIFAIVAILFSGLYPIDIDLSTGFWLGIPRAGNIRDRGDPLQWSISHPPAKVPRGTQRTSQGKTLYHP
jgi:hypothetical protein